MIEDLNKLNPKPGCKYTDFLIRSKPKNYYKLYNWMLKDEYKYLDFIEAFCSLHQKCIDKYCRISFTVQEYYDVIVLGLLNEEQRPVCPICGKRIKFYNMGHGYLTTCSKECHKKLKKMVYDKNDKMLKKGEKARPESNLKKSIASNKIQIWNNPEWRKKHSDHMKEFAKTEEGKKFYKMVGERVSIANIKRSLDTNKNKNLYNNKLYHKGVYYSKVYNMNYNYDSGWELEFIKYMENDNIKNNIKIFDRSRVIIPYTWEDGSNHKYLPDFYIKFNSGLSIVIEIKPNYLLSLDKKVILKINAAKEYFKNKETKFIVLTEKQLINNNKIKKTFNILDYIK